MKFYYCEGTYFRTLAEAKEEAKARAMDSCDDIVVKRAEVSNSHDNVLRMLNSAGGDTEFFEEVYIAKAAKRKD